MLTGDLFVLALSILILLGLGLHITFYKKSMEDELKIRKRSDIPKIILTMIFIQILPAIALYMLFRFKPYLDPFGVVKTCNRYESCMLTHKLSYMLFGAIFALFWVTIMSFGVAKIRALNKKIE